MSAILDGNVLYLTGEVGFYDDSTDCFLAADVIYALMGTDPSAPISVHINSPGGWAMEGAAIYALLSFRPGRVDVVVEGVAASAGSLIAMAGETVSMAPGSVMMIHDPRCLTFGPADAHKKSIDEMETLAASYAQIYAQKSGKSVAECRNLMRSEIWLTPEQAVAEGFADEVLEVKKKIAFAAFDYTKFQNAPNRLVALAKSKNWLRPATAQPETQQGKGQKMSKDNQAHASATARIRAIMKAPEAGGREELAEHLAYETDMTSDAAIAIMSTAPEGAGNRPNDEWVPPSMRYRDSDQTFSRLNGRGLNMEHGRGSKPVSRLVSSMKERFNGKKGD